MRWKNKEKVEINAVFSIDEKDSSLEDIFQQVYNSKNYTSWFNWKPFVWLSFDQEYLDVGCKGVVHFTIPPFKYELSVVNVKKNELIELRSDDNRLFYGSAKMKFYKKEGKIYYEDPHILYGRNVLIHKYYSIFLAGKHVPYMMQRFEKLRSILLKSNRK